ncbi:FAD-binding and (Fe-S)-binding domain-containing protein [Dyella sp.]|jgi:FAD/FMN-containing dehydrogenase/Fe-S oxidoreductase|uniref:FAD-binding and (Fe-S)-binding domain-containing protein n=1 Tax=Dyella sp. TaxID=1869338 RepID=UPI002D79145D|nr:FAD-linked oxidase C-terminal domain-containing protein [Dyella sp.]HET6433123.1 FAD-linked oxidase C-terminal domain-containing protein [Dyella sp.]
MHAAPAHPRPGEGTGRDARAWPDAQAAALAAALTQAVRGEVRFDAGTRGMYATDGSIYRQVPIGVVVPLDVDDVLATLRVCHAHDAPVLARGGGTSLAGQCCNVAVVMDCSRHLREILSLDPQARLARVRPGCILDALRDAAERVHLTFGPDPSTHAHNTLGGMVGNNSCGVHSVMAGRTADNVRSLDIVTYDGVRMRVGATSEEELEQIIREGGRRGEIYAGLRAIRDRYADEIRRRYPRIPRRVSGYNLDQLLPENGFHVARALVGSEGTCVTVLEAELELVPSPRSRTLVVLGYPDIFEAGDHVPAILAHQPIGLEGIDAMLIDNMKRKHMHPRDRKLLPEGKGWLMVEFGGDDKDEADRKARAMMDALAREASPPCMKLFDDQAEEALLWQVRESGLGATARVPGRRDTHPGWEDAAVPPDQVGAYLRDYRALLDKYDYDCALYGHFGDGCIHCRVNYSLDTPAAVAQWHAFMEEASDLVLSYGGSNSGEHGDGQIRAWLLPKMFGEELMQAFAQFKALWDPSGRMNPGKVVDPYPPDADLRRGPSYQPPRLGTEFAYPDDDMSFARATTRCVGVGNCRNQSGGVMCPSYRATQEERYSTRGRARLLFEMLEGDPLDHGWRSPAVHEALDLCLACKGCKSDCPINVDMATYKAEFMSHFYRGRLRPRTAYAMGLIYWWARLGSRVPRLTNALLRAPGLSRLSKFIGGIAQRRTMPSFATRTFRAWFAGHEPANPHGPPVLLWPDTFNNYLHPQPLQDAVLVLEAAGYRVQMPQAELCCGRPLYAEGMLDLARHQLRDILHALAGPIDADVPVVGLEPSCVTSFRDELPRLFPGDEKALWLSRNTFIFSEFIERSGYLPPPLRRKALVHAHCHHHAVLGTAAEKRLLGRLGLDVTWLDAGCCGMAGSFGFDARKVDVSVRVGELQLLPAVRAAAPDTLIITNGFSCRQQIAQCTGRQALDVSQVLAMAVRQGPPHLLPVPVSLTDPRAADAVR